MFDTNMDCHIFHDYNIIFDEKGSSYGVVRKVQWVKEGKEPDESKAKLEIRKIRVSEAGETFGKGYTFSTEEGPNELVKGMIEAGFGHTKEILRAVRNREDFLEAANSINEDDEDSDSGEMFDMRELLSGINEEMDDAV